MMDLGPIVEGGIQLAFTMGGLAAQFVIATTVATVVAMGVRNNPFAAGLLVAGLLGDNYL